MEALKYDRQKNEAINFSLSHPSLRNPRMLSFRLFYPVMQATGIKLFVVRSTKDRSSIYILRQSLTPLFHFRERFPFIKSTGTLDEETGRRDLKRKDWQLSKYRRWQTRSFLKTFDSNNKFSSDKTNAARSNYSQDVEYLFQKRPLSFFLFFFLSSSHPLSASTLPPNLL